MDRALILEDPIGTRLLYDAGRTVAGPTDPRLGKIDVILVSHVHGDHIGDKHIKAINSGSCAKPDGLYVDNHKIGSFYGIWPVYHVHKSSSMFSSSVSYSYSNMESSVTADWTATPGNHHVKCVMTGNHFLNDENTANDVKDKLIKVPVALGLLNMKPISGKKPLQVGATRPGTVKLNSVFVKNAPNPHLRSCRTSLSAMVDIDKNQFFGQFGPTIKIPTAKLTLYLEKSQLINDTVFCTCATDQNRAKTTIEIPCKNAQSDKPNAFRC